MLIGLQRSRFVGSKSFLVKVDCHHGEAGNQDEDDDDNGNSVTSGLKNKTMSNVNANQKENKSEIIIIVKQCTICS